MRDEFFTTSDEENKAFSLRIRMSMKEKSDFYGVCARQGMTPSKVIRQMMKEYVKRYKDTNIL